MHNEEEKVGKVNLEVEDEDHVIHQIGSMKKKPKPLNRKNSSFFMKKMMSFKSRAQIGADEDEDYSSSGDDSYSDEDEAKEESGDKSTTLFIDPPMPKIGNPVNIDMLITRNHKAQSGLKILMEMVSQDVADAVKDASNIPVSHELDRVQVSHEATVRMAKVRTTRDIEKRVQQSIKDIQKSLNYRKSALIMMNSNYSHKQVRKIEPIYVNETRSIIQHHT